MKVKGVSYSYDNVNRLTQIDTEANSTMLSSHTYLYYPRLLLDAVQRTQAEETVLHDPPGESLKFKVSGFKFQVSSFRFQVSGSGFVFATLRNPKSYIHNSSTLIANRGGRVGCHSLRGS
jgi:hypothetical protein